MESAKLTSTLEHLLWHLWLVLPEQLEELRALGIGRVSDLESLRSRSEDLLEETLNLGKRCIRHNHPLTLEAHTYLRLVTDVFFIDNIQARLIPTDALPRATRRTLGAVYDPESGKVVKIAPFWSDRDAIVAAWKRVDDVCFVPLMHIVGKTATVRLNSYRAADDLKSAIDEIFLTEKAERLIVALPKSEALTAEILTERAGVENNSDTRTCLSTLVRMEIFGKRDGNRTTRGYFQTVLGLALRNRLRKQLKK